MSSVRSNSVRWVTNSGMRSRFCLVEKVMKPFLRTHSSLGGNAARLAEIRREVDALLLPAKGQFADEPYRRLLNRIAERRFSIEQEHLGWPNRW